MTWRIALAFVIAGLAAFAGEARKPERHHIYYCAYPYTGQFLPCMYRRNDPVPV